MNPLRWLILAACVLLAEAVAALRSRKRLAPEEDARTRRSVANSLRERRIRGEL